MHKLHIEQTSRLKIIIDCPSSHPKAANTTRTKLQHVHVYTSILAAMPDWHYQDHGQNCVHQWHHLVDVRRAGSGVASQRCTLTKLSKPNTAARRPAQGSIRVELGIGGWPAADDDRHKGRLPLCYYATGLQKGGPHDICMRVLTSETSSEHLVLDFTVE